MLTCKEIAEQATSYMEGGLPIEARRLVEAHLQECEGCRALLAQLDATVRLAGSLPAPAPSAAARAAVLRQFQAWKASGAPASATAAASPPAASTAGRRLAIAALAVGAVTAVLLLSGRHPSHLTADWIVGAGLALVAAGVAALPGRLGGRVVLVVSAALAAALVRGGEGTSDLGQGLDCLATEAGAAGALALVGRLVARRTALPASAGAWAVGGALAGAAALQVTCGAHGVLAHLAIFHAGGVLAVLAIAALASRRAGATAAAAG